ncbi:class I SAM-dependent methyltransferase [Vibrio sp. SCSIO 43140]|uniref:class I SAM-dependent methyltransferase n=1 Tax=Vibrio sp. SCSIO 43140 TaxID=2819100 RepID=UPI0020764948|nr:class I SAM-dependent methyltransferase [Vibrio sp. SCSIO 43140]USD63110.1 class I SAM-dependent methyltransferase [Vibrio sp. SCSIO 43140]
MFNKLNDATEKPQVWSAYTADLLWTDTHIAKQMLAFHLNPDIEAASRSFSFIDESVDWLVNEFDLNASSKTIDFGCGPGLYTHRLKSRGIGTVVGLDFSENSLRYAKQQAEQAGLEIEYRLGNYLDHQETRTFDLITMVMCDFCALNPTQRSSLLAKFKSMLAPTGSIALDVYTTTRFAKQSESLTLDKNAMNGFWSAQDYWCIQSNFTYQDEKVTLDKYVIYEEESEKTVYNWLQHFSLEQIKAELEVHGLTIKASYRDLRGKPLVEADEMALVIGHTPNK